MSCGFRVDDIPEVGLELAGLADPGRFTRSGPSADQIRWRSATSCQRLVLMTSMAHCGPVDLARRRSPVSRVTCSASARAT